MSADVRPSAKIYQFPRKAQASFAAADRRGIAPASPRFQTAPTVEYGGWYHEAAIEAERARKP